MSENGTSGRCLAPNLDLHYHYWNVVYDDGGDDGYDGHGGHDDDGDDDIFVDVLVVDVAEEEVNL